MKYYYFLNKGNIRQFDDNSPDMLYNGNLTTASNYTELQNYLGGKGYILLTSEQSQYYQVSGSSTTKEIFNATPDETKEFGKVANKKFNELETNYNNAMTYTHPEQFNSQSITLTGNSIGLDGRQVMHRMKDLSDIAKNPEQTISTYTIIDDNNTIHNLTPTQLLKFQAGFEAHLLNIIQQKEIKIRTMQMITDKDTLENYDVSII